MNKEFRNMNLFIVGALALIIIVIQNTKIWVSDSIRVGIALFFVILWAVYNSHYFIIQEIREHGGQTE